MYEQLKQATGDTSRISGFLAHFAVSASGD